MDERVLAGRGRQLFDQGLHALATDEARARGLFEAAAQRLLPLTLSEDRLIRRNGHLGMAMITIIRNDAPGANTHLNWLLYDGWDPTLPAVRSAVAGLGRQLSRAGRTDEALLAAALALRVDLTINALSPAPSLTSALGAAERVVAPPPKVAAPLPHVVAPARPLRAAPAFVTASPAPGKRAFPPTPVAVLGTSVTRARPPLEQRSSQREHWQVNMPPAPRKLTPVEQDVVRVGGQSPRAARSGDWVVRGRKIRWIDPLREDDDDSDFGPLLTNLAGALQKFVGRVHRVATHVPAVSSHRI